MRWVGGRQRAAYMIDELRGSSSRSWAFSRSGRHDRTEMSAISGISPRAPGVLGAHRDRPQGGGHVTVAIRRWNWRRVSPTTSPGPILPTTSRSLPRPCPPRSRTSRRGPTFLEEHLALLELHPPHEPRRATGVLKSRPSKSGSRRRCSTMVTPGSCSWPGTSPGPASCNRPPSTKTFPRCITTRGVPSPCVPRNTSSPRSCDAFPPRSCARARIEDHDVGVEPRRDRALPRVETEHLAGAVATISTKRSSRSCRRGHPGTGGEPILHRGSRSGSSRNRPSELLLPRTCGRTTTRPEVIRHETLPQFLLVIGVRSGGEHTNLAPSLRASPCPRSRGTGTAGRFPRRRHTAIARVAHGVEGIPRGEMDDVRGRAGQFGHLEYAVDRLAFHHGGPRQAVVHGSVFLREVLADQDIDRAAVLRMHHDQGAGVARAASPGRSRRRRA